MNLRKFISGVSAFAIAASAFAGLAVTANAASLDDITASGDRSISITKRDDYQFVFDFDVYVATGASVTFVYYNNGNLGPQFRFTDEDGDGWVAIQYNISNTWNDINTSHPYSIYKADNTIHVTMTTEESAGGMGNTKISVSGDNATFTQAKDAGYTVRVPKQDRDISSRNLHSRTLNKITFTVNNAANETTATGITNATYVNRKIAMSNNATTCAVTYGEDTGASVWSAEITNDTAIQLTKATATATLSADGTTKASSDETTITEMAPGSSAVFAVVVNKQESELSDVTISLK